MYGLVRHPSSWYVTEGEIGDRSARSPDFRPWFDTSSGIRLSLTRERGTCRGTWDKGESLWLTGVTLYPSIFHREKLGRQVWTIRESLLSFLQRKIIFVGTIIFYLIIFLFSGLWFVTLSVSLFPVFITNILILTLFVKLCVKPYWIS